MQHPGSFGDWLAQLQRLQNSHGELLRGIPSIKAIFIMRNEQRQGLRGIGIIQANRRREASQQRGNRFGLYSRENKLLIRVGYVQHFISLIAGKARACKHERITLLIKQTHS